MKHSHQLITNGTALTVPQLLKRLIGEPHDYEPGDRTTPMQTDPLCRVCGQTKRNHS